jgi:IS5 family transposase
MPSAQLKLLSGNSKQAMASLDPMKQASLDLNLSAKKTRKREFLEQMERAVPWTELVTLIAPYYPEGRTGRPPFAMETMLRVHLPSAMVQPVGPGNGGSVL